MSTSKLYSSKLSRKCFEHLYRIFMNTNDLTNLLVFEISHKAFYISSPNINIHKVFIIIILKINKISNIDFESMPGTIMLKPLEAKLTHNTSIMGMDPYCQITVGQKQIKGEVCQKGGKNPHWKDVITVRADQDRCLFEIKDKSTLLPDREIGSFEMDLHEVEVKGQIKKWYPIMFEDKPAGEVLLEATFSPENQDLIHNIDQQMGMGLAGMVNKNDIPKDEVLEKTQPENLGPQEQVFPQINKEKMQNYAEHGNLIEEKENAEAESTELPKPEQKIDPADDLFHCHHKEFEGLDLTSEMGPHRIGYDKNLWQLPENLKDLK